MVPHAFGIFSWRKAEFSGELVGQNEADGDGLAMHQAGGIIAAGAFKSVSKCVTKIE